MYVLIITLITYNSQSAAVHSVQFANKAACETVAASYRADTKNIRDERQVAAVAKCYPVGP